MYYNDAFEKQIKDFPIGTLKALRFTCRMFSKFDDGYKIAIELIDAELKTRYDEVMNNLGR